MALLSVDYTHIQKSCMETLHDSYAHQLQSLGLWHWAVFVLMHIENDDRREQAVKSYLARHVTSVSSELDAYERFVIDKLHVPAEWIYELKAMRAKCETHLTLTSGEQNSVQIKLLIKAHKFNDAHALLIDALAPDLFLKRTLRFYSIIFALEGLRCDEI